jgi:chromosome segregation ATPase
MFGVEMSISLQAWRSAVPREVLEGLLNMDALRRQHGLKGVAGCLVDLIDVPSQLVTATDTVAGNQLFQVREAS